VRAIQVNFCKNPACANFGVPASLRKYARRASAPTLLPGTEYTLQSGGAGLPLLVCRLCGEFPPIKSNLGISEEIHRLADFMVPAPQPCCPVASCTNHCIPVGTKGAYYAYGKTDQGSKRYKCRACGKTFSVAQRATLRQRLPQKNVQVFKLLMNKMPLTRICEVADISIQTLYDKIDFIHRQCLAFAAKQERKLLDGLVFRRLYVAVDRQDYVVNWTQRKDKRNITLRALGSADLASGYVFGMHLNFDASLNPLVTEAQAHALGDYTETPPFRRHARLWLEPDYTKAVAETVTRVATRRRKAAASLQDGIADVYADAASREDVESPEVVTSEESWPKRGMQVRNEYTMYAHFYLLRQMFRGVQKVRFFMDQESGIRAACLAAFEREITDRRCDAFYVRLGKELTVDEKRRVITESRAEFKRWQDAHPNLTPSEVEVLMMKAELARAAAIGKWSDKWCVHPFPNNAEPEKSICWLTDIDEPPSDPAEIEDRETHVARLYLKGSLHAIDRFFMQVRRRLSLLERPVSTSSRAGRTWHGYSAYQPENIEKVLAIFRVFYNYCLAGKDTKTPAMRMGLVHAVSNPRDIL
jgi:transposase-like protein